MRKQINKQTKEGSFTSFTLCSIGIFVWKCNNSQIEFINWQNQSTNQCIITYWLGEFNGKWGECNESWRFKRKREGLRVFYKNIEVKWSEVREIEGEWVSKWTNEWMKKQTHTLSPLIKQTYLFIKIRKNKQNTIYSE